MKSSLNLIPIPTSGVSQHLLRLLLEPFCDFKLKYCLFQWFHIFERHSWEIERYFTEYFKLVILEAIIFIPIIFGVFLNLIVSRII